MMEQIEAFWNRYLQMSGKDRNTKYLEVFHFELSEFWANELLKLVLDGRKRATASCLQYWETTGEKCPEAGDLSIVTDWAGTPRCVIETTAVEILPFKDMTFERCKREGEDDCLETWIVGHIRYFTADGNETGYVFTEDSPVVFEDFVVVYQE